MKTNKVAINTVANLVSRVWTMLATYLFVPVYISYLGEEAYGLITFFATLQTTLNLLGLGLSKSLRREFASDESKDKSPLYKYQILRSVESIYFIISIFIICICYFGAGFISEKYLVVSEIPIETVVLTIRLMGISIAAQLLANLYLGCLFGQERQVLSNIIQIIWSVSKNVGVVIVISLIVPNISLFYAWHVIVDIIYLIVLREIVLLDLKKKSVLHWSIKDLSNIKGVIVFTIGIMIISIGYSVNTQADKIIISGSFPLSVVGAYNTAYNLSFVASVFVAAMGVAVFPRFTKCFTAGNIEEQKKEFVKNNRIANIVTITIGAFLAAFSYELLLVWTGRETIADTMKIAAIPLIIGTVFNALQEIPYNYFLSCGVTKINTVQTVCSIFYVLIITPIMIYRFGLLGAALSWFVQMAAFTIVYLLVFYLKYFKIDIIKRLVVDTFVPLIISSVLAFASHQITVVMKMSSIHTILFGVAFGLITLIFMFLVFCSKDYSLRVLKKIR